ncbi:hypothetical protein [Lysinibacillus sphaericus]|uniref:Uncharacterized protein n=1 Tax=Lysinibacillus sphaericus OT4b.31 TaxID=1285586 RepID=R7Z837_LYSSH|nr:hypothetical protein [Lysinibacillus sphaericus]EON70278.1 hypothetical protein H131_22169 [Lysinibacillus sphaericus OT4b.31]
MKKTLSLLLVFFLLLPGLLLYRYYWDAAIEQDILTANSYRTTIGEEYRAVNFFVKPDWFTLHSKKPQSMHEVVTRIGNSKIVLTEVKVREEVQDIYFTFTIENKLPRSQGYFLTQNLRDASIDIAMPFIELRGDNEQSIALGQFSQGPGDFFSFGLNLEDATAIPHGFSVVANLYYGVQYEKD